LKVNFFFIFFSLIYRLWKWKNYQFDFSISQSLLFTLTVSCWI
jgi:hypothetical protein